MKGRRHAWVCSHARPQSPLQLAVLALVLAIIYDGKHAPFQVQRDFNSRSSRVEGVENELQDYAEARSKDEHPKQGELRDA